MIYRGGSIAVNRATAISARQPEEFERGNNNALLRILFLHFSHEVL